MSEKEFNQNGDITPDSADSESKKKSEKTEEITEPEIKEGRNMAVLSYIVPIIPYFYKDKDNKFVKFHARQGMNLFLVLIIYTVVYNILTATIKVGHILNRGGAIIRITPWWVTFPLSLVGCALAVMDIMGIVQALNGETQELPIIKDLKIFK
ncbi:MAG: DUF4870 domain-containing protein [Clostridia bacterium]|nr:DUF4870 domain-containing protein [Clostridia bacterium]